MGQIALQIPQVNLPDATEDPKIASDLAAIQAVINGNIDDTNLRSPNSAVRHLLLQASGVASPFTPANTYFLGAGALVQSNTGTSVGVPFWPGDAGLSSQPQDFQVANKTGYGRVRCVIVSNAAQVGVTYTIGLWQLGSVSQSGSSIVYNISGSALSGSTVAFGNPGAGAILTGISNQFVLPTTVWWALTVGISGGSPPANAITGITAQLYGYNA